MLVAFADSGGIAPETVEKKRCDGESSCQSPYKLGFKCFLYVNGRLTSPFVRQTFECLSKGCCRQYGAERDGLCRQVVGGVFR